MSLGNNALTGTLSSQFSTWTALTYAPWVFAALFATPLEPGARKVGLRVLLGVCPRMYRSLDLGNNLLVGSADVVSTLTSLS